MKKPILTIIFYLLILLNAFAQSEEASKITITANYLLSSINFSVKGMDNKSILTWRDIYLHGGYLNVDFQKAPFYFDRSNISIGFSSSFYGYWTDDDANNRMNVIHVSTTETILLELKYEMHTRKSTFNPKLGFDFNMIQFKNYDSRALYGKPNYPQTLIIWQNIEGFVCGYDIYKMGPFAGVSAYFGNRFVYMEASGQIGTGLYADLGNWKNNSVFKNPVSFLDYGYYFRGGSDIEAGLKLGMFTIFINALLTYEINPGFGITQQFLSDDTYPLQLQSFQLSRASLGAGLKVSF